MDIKVAINTSYLLEEANVCYTTRLLIHVTKDWWKLISNTRSPVEVVVIT